MSLTIGLLVGSLHFNPAADGPPRATPGVYASQGPVAGALYHNCEGRTSLMLGANLPFRVAGVEASAQLGLVSGYRSLKRPLYLGLSVPLGAGMRAIVTPKALALGVDF